MLCIFFYFHLFITIVLKVTSATLDNEVLGSNDIKSGLPCKFIPCRRDNTMPGRYDFGMSDRRECVQSFASSNPPTNNPSMSFGFGACNMHRSRMIDPQPGMMQSIVVVISFHKTFITKVDKAYAIQCFYMEVEKMVSSELEVSMLTTNQLRNTAQTPICTYEVRQENSNGPLVRHAQVGDAVFHVWSCNSDSHKILVKNCFVDDGQGNQVKLINEYGCAEDSTVVDDLTYTPSEPGKAWVNGFVFKFADKPNVLFHCTIQLCNRGDQTCESITPPKCKTVPAQMASQEVSPEANIYSYILKQQRSKRFQRERRENGIDKVAIDQLQSREIDLYTTQITVFDLDTSELNKEKAFGQLSTDQPKCHSGKRSEICFCKPVYSVLLLCLLAICSTLPIILTISCWQRQYCQNTLTKR